MPAFPRLTRAQKPYVSAVRFDGQTRLINSGTVPGLPSSTPYFFAAFNIRPIGNSGVIYYIGTTNASDGCCGNNCYIQLGQSGPRFGPYLGIFFGDNVSPLTQHQRNIIFNGGSISNLFDGNYHQFLIAANTLKPIATAIKVVYDGVEITSAGTYGGQGAGFNMVVAGTPIFVGDDPFPATNPPPFNNNPYIGDMAGLWVMYGTNMMSTTGGIRDPNVIQRSMMHKPAYLDALVALRSPSLTKTLMSSKLYRGRSV